MVQEHWKDLADDVESGQISSRIVLDAWFRSKLEKGMKPDPVRGDELRTAISKGFEGIALRLWPRLHLIHTVDSGPHQIYGESLRQHYCRGVPFYSPLYATTEGHFICNYDSVIKHRSVHMYDKKTEKTGTIKKSIVEYGAVKWSGVIQQSLANYNRTWYSIV